MNTIIFWTIFTAVVAGFFLTCIIEAISKAVKKRKYDNRISIKMYRESDMWWVIAFAILHGLKAIAEIYELKYCDFTESVLSKIKIVCYLLIFCTFIFAFFLRTRAYITEKGIITNMSFLPVSGVKYSVKKEYDEYIIELYTKNKKPSYIYCTKKEKAISMLENHYEKADGNAPVVKFKSGTAKYLLTLLCTSLIFIGGIFAWYEIEMPVVFVGDKIVKTDSEYAIFHLNMLYGERIQIPYDIIDKLYEERDVSEKITSKDTAALKKMPNLKYLNLMCNNIDDLTEIGELTQLEMLRFGGGDMYEKPTDFSPLKNLKKLKYFTGAGCSALNDLTLFEDMDELVYFELTMADIQSGLDVICEKENLLCLNLFYCTSEDFSPIGKCATLKTLVLEDTNIDDLSFLENLTNLEYLDIDFTNAEDYSVLLKLPSLKKLSVSNCDIPDEIIKELTKNGVEIYD